MEAESAKNILPELYSPLQAARAWLRKGPEYYEVSVDEYPKRNCILLIPTDTQNETMFIAQAAVKEFHLNGNNILIIHHDRGDMVLEFSTINSANNVMQLLQKVLSSTSSNVIPESYPFLEM